MEDNYSQNSSFDTNTTAVSFFGDEELDSLLALFTEPISGKF